MKMKKGRWLPITENRRLVLDVCVLSRGIPFFPAERFAELSCVSEARSKTRQRVSWAAVFVKAFALVARQEPVLRQAYMRWPIPHLYEHAFSNVSMAVHREVDGEDRLCWAQINRIDELSLIEIQSHLDRFTAQPVKEVFAKQKKLARLPAALRRFVWHLGLDLSGKQRAKSMGTFSVSSLAGLDAFNRFHPTILTSSLSYGPVENDGSCLLTLICDHRVIDGYRAAICLRELDSVLNNDVLKELRSLSSHDERSVA